MKVMIRRVQTFYAEQMQAHGYGNRTFRIETDAQGEPMVHQMEGQYPEKHYADYQDAVTPEIAQVFDLQANIYLVVSPRGSYGGRYAKSGGRAVVAEFSINRRPLVAHELGHAFGLKHDFRDDSYIMSYGSSRRNRLSACAAEFLAVHSYFNHATPIERGQWPTIEHTSPPTYPVGSESVSVQLKLSDVNGLHQVRLQVRTRDLRSAAGSSEVKECRGLADEKDAVVEFEYDGFIPSSTTSTSLSDADVHEIEIVVVNTDGNEI